MSRRDIEDRLAASSLEEDSPSESDEEEDAGDGTNKMAMGAVGLLSLAAVVIGMVFLLSGPSGGAARKGCAGYDVCPGYPMPYAFGQWPESYAIEGAFPPDFIFGLGTASYQVEGAYREDGRGATIWDTFTGANTIGMPGADCSYCCKAPPCAINPAMSARGATGNVACDHYHMYKEDVALMKSMGLKHYRFSIAWSRLFPTGFVKDGINEKGIEFYSSLIDELLKAGITPYVTLYHWDLPQGLLDPPRYQAWWARDNMTGEPRGEIIPEFVAFADLCFSRFGTRVKTWLTFNEPWSATMLASGWGKAPSIPAFSNMSVDPWIAGHNMLNAHAAVVDLYRRKYQAQQGGKIGITLNCNWGEPKTDSPEDIGAAERNVLFTLGWYADPIYYGDYPEPMKRIYGARLPKFTEAEKKLLLGSTDFLGINHYSTTWVSYTDKAGADLSHSKQTHEGLLQGQSSWLFSSAWGVRKQLNWIKRRYNNPPVYLTEGGWSLAAEGAKDGTNDRQRTLYYANYTSEVLKALKEDKIDVRSYFGWSFLDNFEWNMGYKERFGVVYNDYRNGPDPNAPTAEGKQPTAGSQMRRRKESSCWLETLWRNNTLIDPRSPSFTGCVTHDSFARQYTSPDSTVPGATYTITVDQQLDSDNFFDAVGTVAVTLPPDGLEGQHVAAEFSGGTILVDFAMAPIFGFATQVVGYWNKSAESIVWGDGTTWIATNKSA